MTCPNCGGQVTRDVVASSSGTSEVLVCVGAVGDAECGWADSREIPPAKRTA